MRNKTLKYLVPKSLNGKTKNGIELRNLFADNEELLISGFYSGYQKLDNDNNIYMLSKVLSDSMLSKIASSEVIKEIIPIGDVLDNTVLLVFGMEETKNVKKLFVEGKYSQLYTIEQVKSLLSRGELDKDTANVLLKAAEKKRELENTIGSSLPTGAELDSSINLSEEVYDYRV